MVLELEPNLKLDLFLGSKSSPKLVLKPKKIRNETNFFENKLSWEKKWLD
jgi:hypothetical protein